MKTLAMTPIDTLASTAAASPHGAANPEISRSAALPNRAYTSHDEWLKERDTVVAQSGMSAISSMLLALAKPGDVIVYSEPIYGGTDTLLNGLLKQLGMIPVGFMSSEGISAFKAAVADAKNKGNIAVVMLETPDNPTNNLLDIAECRRIMDEATAGQAEKPVLAVDNTVVGPIWQKPLDHGADLCLYSLTKYVGGHSDLVGGSISGSKDIVTKVRRVRNAIGTTMDWPNTHLCYFLNDQIRGVRLPIIFGDQAIQLRAFQ